MIEIYHENHRFRSALAKACSPLIGYKFRLKIRVSVVQIRPRAPPSPTGQGQSPTRRERGCLFTVRHCRSGRLNERASVRAAESGALFLPKHRLPARTAVRGPRPFSARGSSRARTSAHAGGGEGHGLASAVDPGVARRYLCVMRSLAAFLLAAIWIVASTVTASAGAAHGASHATALHATVGASHGHHGHAHEGGAADHGGEAEDHAGCGSILSCSGFFASLPLPAQDATPPIAEAPEALSEGRFEGLRPGFQPPPPKPSET